MPSEGVSVSGLIYLNNPKSQRVLFSLSGFFVESGGWGEVELGDPVKGVKSVSGITGFVRVLCHFFIGFFMGKIKGIGHA